MRVKKQFNRYATEYEKYSIIQQSGVEMLISLLPKKLGDILDLGAGSGRVYRELIRQNREFKSFLGVDFSANMLKLHPKDRRVKLLEGDFNNTTLFNKIEQLNKERGGFDYILSASALQWARDLDFTLNMVSKVGKRVGFFIFTSGTFKELHRVVKRDSPIHSKEKVLNSFNRFFISEEVRELNFKLEFNSTLEMLRYIKKSGVSGGGMGLTVKEVREILKSYPKEYLEFETLILTGKSREQNRSG